MFSSSQIWSPKRSTALRSWSPAGWTRISAKRLAHLDLHAVARRRSERDEPQQGLHVQRQRLVDQRLIYRREIAPVDAGRLALALT